MSKMVHGYSLEEHTEGESRQLDAPIVHLNLQNELTDLRRPAAAVEPPSADGVHVPSHRAWQLSGHSAKTLAKYPDLRVVLITLKCGESLGEHRTAGPMSLQIIDGSVRVTLSSGVVDLTVGAFLALGASVPHDVQALNDSAVLLNIAGPT